MNEKNPSALNTDVSLGRRHVLQGLASTTLPWAFSPLAHAAVVGNNNPASWASNTDPNIYAQAFARRFTNLLPNPLSPKATSGVSAIYRADGGTGSVYTIAASQGRQDVLGIPGIKTTVWGYHNFETGPTFPGRSFEVRQGYPVTVRWRNNLLDASGPLPHIFGVDQTITIQTPTTGVPLATHHHGGDNAYEFDGGPNQWATPQRRQIGPGIAADNSLKQLATDIPALSYRYDNTQEASLHWYHDHAESLTRINVGAGLAGLYVVRDANEDSLVAAGILPARDYEIALVIQDRNFDAAGNFAYAANPVNYPQPLDPSFPRNNPTHMPEMFGDIICVNGLAWPKLDVEPRSYRVRLLNGSDSRFYTLNFGAQTGVYQIGTDLGLMNRGVKLTTVTVAPGERMDLVLDFSAYKGPTVTTTQKVWVSTFLWWGYWTTVTTQTPTQPTVNIDVTNSAPTPFPGTVPPVGGAALVMRFAVSIIKSNAKDISAAALTGTNLRPKLAALPASPAVPARVRRILLGEGVDQYGRVTPMLGVYDPTGQQNLGTLSLNDPVTEKPTVGSSEVWEFWNTTVDAHPVHLHLVQFRVLNRQAFTGTTTATVMSTGWEGVRLDPGATLAGTARPAPANEQGWKDTVVCPPGEVTRVVAQFNRAGTFVYHCHILSHEDHDMMRYYQVVAPAGGGTTPGSPSFDLTLKGLTRIKLSGSYPTNTIPIGVQAVNGFNGTVSFQLDSSSGSTQSVSWTFYPSTIKGSGITTLSLKRLSGIAYPAVFNFSARSGGITRQFSVEVSD